MFRGLGLRFVLHRGLASLRITLCVNRVSSSFELVHAMVRSRTTCVRLRLLFSTSDYYLPTVWQKVRRLGGPRPWASGRAPGRCPATSASPQSWAAFATLARSPSMPAGLLSVVGASHMLSAWQFGSLLYPPLDFTLSSLDRGGPTIRSYRQWSN